MPAKKKSGAVGARSNKASEAARDEKEKPKAGKGAKPDARPEAAPALVVARRDLDRDLVEQIRTELLRKKLDLGANISTELNEMREASEGHHLADMDDLGGDAHDEETAYKIIEIESAALDQIDYALDRMGNGTYGVCEGCERGIAPERLKALPFASLCINCKRQQEMGEE